MATYKRKIRFAVVSYLACDIFPGCLLAKSIGTAPLDTAKHISNRCFWSVLNLISDKTGKEISIASNGAFFRFLQVFNSFPIGPEKSVGPVVAPSK